MSTSKEKLKIVNFFSDPGSGKSTTAAGLFYKLKNAGINAELVTEYAKDKVWDNHLSILDDQLYIFAKQYHRILRLQNQVDIVITDSPILLSCHYNKGLLSKGKLKTHFEGLIHELFDTFDNYNYFVKRIKNYNPKGRTQTEDEARIIDLCIKKYLIDKSINFTEINGNNDGLESAYADIIKLLKR